VHPELKWIGSRSIGLGKGQEWLSVPAAMTKAFPNGELSTVSRAHHQAKRPKVASGTAVGNQLIFFAHQIQTFAHPRFSNKIFS
jgi:hypothetical protein